MPDKSAPGGNPSFRIWLVTLRRLGPYRGSCLLVALSIALDIAFNLTFSVAMKFLLDGALTTRDTVVLAQILGGLMLFFVVQASGSIGGNRLAAIVTARLGSDLRRAAFEKLQGFSPVTIARRRAGDMVAYFSTDVGALEGAMRKALPFAVRSILLAVISLVVLFVLDWRLAALALLVIPAGAVGPKSIGPRAVSSAYRHSQANAALAMTVTESFNGSAVVRAFGLRPFMTERFSTGLSGLEAETISAGFFSLLVSLTGNLAIPLGELLVLGIGSMMVAQGLLTVGTLVGFVAVLLQFSFALLDLSRVAPEWLEATGSMQRLNELLDEPDEMSAASSSGLNLPRLRSEIRFDDVSFAYEEQPVLSGISLSIPAGQSVAIVGRSGSGKSTLLNLLARFHDPNLGSVAFDGIDLREASDQSLREQSAVVFQDSFLFDTTIRENIRMGRLDATDVQIETAARVAEIHDLIVSLPQGYDTPVGDRGDRLSGGQRQRVALARAMIRDPALLLLDEATSALDPATETAFNATLAAFAKGRTVVSVTHHLAGAVNADRVLVVQDGAIVEDGNHSALLAQRGVYFEMFERQSGFELSDDGQKARIEPLRLAQLQLFRGLDSDLLEPFAGLFQTEHAAQGGTVYQPGDDSDRFYIVVRGKVEEAAAPGTLKSAVPVEVYEAGDVFGEGDLLQGRRRSTQVRTLTDCTLLSLGRDHFHHMLERIPLLRTIVEQVSDVHDQKAATQTEAAAWTDTA